MFRKNLIVVWVGVIILSGMFLTGQESWESWPLDCEVVAIPDPNLYSLIQAQLGIGYRPICASDLQNITSFQAPPIPSFCPTDLTGLEHCTGLIELILDECMHISDLSPLAGLTNLESLYLNINAISDLSPLSGLINLTELRLAWNQITDISPLAGLIALSELWLMGNQISDLSPLAGLTNMRALHLYGNQISDLSPLSVLSNLTELGLGENQISDLYPLIDNLGIDLGDLVRLDRNPLSPRSCTVHIPELEDRGVTVYHDCP